jgi:hypothetical protein
MVNVRQIQIGAKRGMISLFSTRMEGLMMRSDLGFSLVMGVLLMLLVVLSRRRCRGGKTTPAATKPPRVKRDPKPFAGLSCKPDCPVCEHKAESYPAAAAPNAPPPRMLVTRSRRRHVETTGHFCPQVFCAYHGRVDWGNIRANGHPMARRVTASRWSRTSWYGRLRRWLKASASAP